MGENLTEMDFSPQQGSLETLVVWDQHAQDSALFVLPLLQGWLLCPAKASGIVREGFCSLPVHVPTSPGWDVVGNGPALLSTDLPQQQAGAGGDSTRDQGTLSLARGLRARPSPVYLPQPGSRQPAGSWHSTAQADGQGRVSTNLPQSGLFFQINLCSQLFEARFWHAGDRWGSGDEAEAGRAGGDGGDSICWVSLCQHRQGG